MDFFHDGVRRCSVKGAEIFEGSTDALKKQGVLHGDYFTAKQAFAVVSMWYDPTDKSDVELFEKESDAVDRICELGRQSTKLGKICRDCDNFGAVCHGVENHAYSGCLMKHMSRSEFVEYNNALMSYCKQKGADAK